MHSIQTLESRFLSWASAQEDFRAAFIVGSQARLDPPADAWSDLDIILFVTDVERRQNDTEWLKEIAPVWLSSLNRTIAGEPERLTLFEGGLQVDFVFHPANILAELVKMVDSSVLPDTILRGAYVLFDKDHLIPPLPAPSKPPAAIPPEQGEFQGTLESFWFGAVYCAKQLRRGELWLFQNGSLGMQWSLLRMVEWHARSLHGWDYDTWHAGKFISEWAETPIYSTLQKTFAHLETADGWQALHARLELFHTLACQLAEHMHYLYPEALESDITACICTIESDQK